MRIKVLALLTIVSLLLSVPDGIAQDKTGASAELKALISKIQEKLRAGKETEADLAPEIKAFDALLAKHQGEKTDDVAQILFMKATLYQEVLKDNAKGEALLTQLKRDFPDSQQVKMLKQQEESSKVRAALAVGSKFPDFSEKDLAGKPLSIANSKARSCCWTSGRPGAAPASTNCPT